MPRIALYSHDSMGLGHVRRNLLLAESLTTRDPTTTALLVSGVHLGAAFYMPPNVDCLTLPAIAKHAEDGAYGSRHLAVPLTRMTRLRMRTMRAALLAFDPDVVVIDNVPRGAMGEAEPALAALKARGRARLVLGLRDVLDEPETVVREWRRSGNHEAIARYYDQVWVYGDPAIYDLARECAFPPSTSSRIEYVGYLDRRRPCRLDGAAPAVDALPSEFALCMAGGGQDGSLPALAFARARSRQCPRIVVGGPFLPDAARRELRDLERTDPDLRVLDFVSDATSLIEKASRVVTMGGYNSVCEALAYAKPTLIVPREWPRREQAIRAERLATLGLADVLPWTEISDHAIRRWLETAVPPRPPVAMNFGALDRVGELVTGLLGARALPAWPAVIGGRLRAS